ncbi:MAG: DUF6879 family protein [Streptosporangiaceae bacterium]
MARPLLTGWAVDPFDRWFDTFTSTAFRLETLPAYPDRQAPERSVRKLPSLKRLRETTGQGKQWSLIRLAHDPLTSYERWEIPKYQESQAAGEDVRISRLLRGATPEGGDFWLFDYDTDNPFVVILDYGPSGDYSGCDLIKNNQCQRFNESRLDVLGRSISLADFLAQFL